jgi:putative phage-type endonuclease
MNRTVHDLVQGSAEWLAHRRNHFNASDAPAMLGISPYKTRSQLLHEMATGIVPDVDAGTQKLFNDGHTYEAQARPVAELIIDDDLYPQVMSADVDGLPLSASLDGITADDETIFEHKSMNRELEAAFGRGEIALLYKVQMEQQLLISGASKCLFMASKGAAETAKHAWYESDPKVRADVLAGWKQFQDDMRNYRPAETAVALVPAPIMALPALVINLTGEVTASNLVEFRNTALEMIAGINTNLQTDQDFVNAKSMVKFCDDAEKEIETTKKLALGKTKSIEELFATMDFLAEQIRQKRLELTRLVTSREAAIKLEIQDRGRAELAEHIIALNTRLGKPYMPVIVSDFPGVMKNKRTITSLNNAVNTEVARCKIEASATADRIDANLKHLRENALEFAELFPDTAQIVLKSPDDLAALVKVRISEHKEAERVRAEKVEADRKAIADAEAKRQAEIAAVPPAAIATSAAVPAAPAPIAAVAGATTVHSAAPAAARDAHEVPNAVITNLWQMTQPEQLEMLNASIAILARRSRKAA